MAGRGGQHVVTQAGMVPVLVIIRHLTLREHHHIEPFTTSHRVAHQVHVGTQPDTDLLAAQ